MKRWISLILLLLPLLASAASFWDGNAALQRGDSTFENGMYAASSAFADDTQIVILNLDTGKSATATVSNRISGQPDILVLLSPKTAAALGVTQGVLASVRVTIAPKAVASSPSANGEQTVSQDPDLNPGAAYGGPTTSTPQVQTTQTQVAVAPTDQDAVETTPAETTTEQTATAETTQETATPVITETTAETATAATAEANPQQAFAAPETPATEEAAAAQSSPTPSLESLPPTAAPAQAATSNTVPVTAPEVPEPTQVQAAPIETAQQQMPEQTVVATATPADQAAAREAEDAAIIAAAEARTPQKQVFLPPREDSAFAYQKPVDTTQQAATTQTAVTPTVTPTVTPVEQPAAPQITSVTGEPEATPAPVQGPEVALAEATVPEESRAQEIVSAETVAPEGTDGLIDIAMAIPEAAPEEIKPIPPEPVQTEVTGPTSSPPVVKPVSRVALATPEAPLPQQAAAQQTSTTTTPAITTQTTAATAPTTSTQSAVTQTATSATVSQAARTPISTTGTTATTTSATAGTAPAVTASLPRTGKPGTFFLQLGAFATEKVARDLAASLSGTYPMLVVAPPTGASVFKVMVGPLNKAESGTLLTWFRFRGFPDAFLKQE